MTLIKHLDITTNLQMTENYAQLHHKYAITKIQNMENSIAQMTSLINKLQGKINQTR